MIAGNQQTFYVFHHEAEPPPGFGAVQVPENYFFDRIVPDDVKKAGVFEMLARRRKMRRQDYFFMPRFFCGVERGLEPVYFPVVDLLVGLRVETRVAGAEPASRGAYSVFFINGVIVA